MNGRSLLSVTSALASFSTRRRHGSKADYTSGWLGATPEGRRPQIRGFRAGGSLAVASSTPATQLLSPAKMLKLNHARRSGRPRYPSHGDPISYFIGPIGFDRSIRSPAWTGGECQGTLCHLPSAIRHLPLGVRGPPCWTVCWRCGPVPSGHREL